MQFFATPMKGYYAYLQEFFLPFSEHFPWTPQYEPKRGVDSFEAIAAREGRSVGEVYYDHLINGGVAWKPFSNSYSWGGYDMTCTMLNHPLIIPGFADAGAHGTVFQDAGIATHMLSYLARDRAKGPKLSVEHAVFKNTLEIARFFGFTDRGALQVGMSPVRSYSFPFP